MPKLRLWAGLIQQQKINDALLQSMAVWEPKKAIELRESVQCSVFSVQKMEKPWEPPSIERIAKKNPHVKKILEQKTTKERKEAKP